MAKELIINATLPETRIALMEDGRIQELLIERQSDRGIVGNIYKGRVTRVLPGMQAAFVDVGLDKAAFLYVDDIYVHPKVMGEETEVDDDSGSEAIENMQESSQEIQPEAGMNAAPSETISEGSANVDTSSLESHSAEQAEQSYTSDENYTSDEIASDMQEAQEHLADDESESDIDADAETEEDEGAAENDLENESENESESDSDGDFEEEVADAVAAAPEGDASPIEGATPESTAADAAPTESLAGIRQEGGRRRPRGRRNRRRGGRNREGGRNQFAGGESFDDPNLVPQSVNESLNDIGNVESDRSAMSGEEKATQTARTGFKRQRPEFREQRGRDRRIKSKHTRPRAQANISDLLREGQEVIVQVAKDPIATKGARLTCHVSLPGRHLVCMPSIDHVGVSRRIERDDERRRLRDFVEKNRPRKMGFIVRTASGGKDPESWIKQDIDYLSKLWGEIRGKADDVSAPALVYEDLNSILRAIRDWVNEDIEKIIVDTRYHYNELTAFAERFMPSLIGKIELYQGDIPVFDAYGLSSELHRSLERRVWLKSGGYIVIDQAEALVAIDVNTGRFVGKKNLEDTILKTNMEAAEEIAYQLRLRNCGGIIIVDFIDMERDDNKMRVYRALDEALKKDRARPTIQKISELGLVEMTRKRTRDTIVRTLCEPCVHCEGKGFTKSTQTVAYEILREIERLSVDREAKKILVSAHESVVNILAIELRDALDQLERRYNKSVYLQSIVDYHAEQFEVVTDRIQGKKQTQDIARQLRIERERTERKEKQKQRRQEYSHREEPEEGASEESAPSIEEKPKARPAGSFIARPKPPVEPKPEGDAVASEAAAGESEEDAQPAYHAGYQPTAAQQAAMADMDEEDQLAYLRAQAAQDAAIAGVPTNQNRGAGRHNNGRNQNNRNQNNRNQRGGRHQRNQRGGGHNFNGNVGNRYRPDNYGNSTVGQAAAASQPQVTQAPATEVEVPDYEVLNRGDDGSNS